MLRLWFPLPANKHTFLQRFTFFRSLNESDKEYIKVNRLAKFRETGKLSTALAVSSFDFANNFNALQLNPGYAWKSIKLISDHQSIDPEYLELINLLKNQSESQIGFTGKELTEEEFIFDPTQNKSLQRKTQALLMAGAHFSIEDQRLIYRHFFAKTFPFFFLTEEKFRQLMDKFGWTPGQIKGLFRAFRGKSHHVNHLSFPEFISGLAACDNNTPHGEACGESRCRYIFRCV